MHDSNCDFVVFLGGSSAAAKRAVPLQQKVRKIMSEKLILQKPMSQEIGTTASNKHILTKVPAVTLIFWVIKIAATTLGETAGDAVSMSMNLGYLIGTAIFGVIFVVAVIAQIRAKKFHPFLYWTTIVATTTVGTTLADFATRSLGIGYFGGSSILLACLVASLFIWHRTLGSISVTTIISPSAEIFYWVTIMFS